MEVPVLVIIERMTLYTALLDKPLYVLVSPIKKGEINTSPFLCGVNSANFWLVVSFTPVLTLRPTDTPDCSIVIFLLLQVCAAVTNATRRLPMLTDKLEESLLGTDDSCADLFDIRPRN